MLALSFFVLSETAFGQLRILLVRQKKENDITLIVV